MRIPQSYIQKCKIVAHVFQAVLIFLGGCMAIAVLAKGGTNGGATAYYLALCFLSIPAIIYNIMVPMWPRAQRFANVYAFLALDILYSILWFAAFIAVALWNSMGIREGVKEVNDNKKEGEEDKEGSCATFKWGSKSKCSVSYATVGFGVVIFILFALTAGISFYYMKKFRKEGILPYESNKANPHHLGGETTKDNAWSTEMDGPGRDSDEDDRRTERGGGQEEDEYALLHSTETDEGRHPGRPLSWGDDRGDDRGSYGTRVPPYASYNDNSDALSPGGYDEYRKDAHAGAGHQPSNLGGQGYSFSGGDR